MDQNNSQVLTMLTDQGILLSLNGKRLTVKKDHKLYDRTLTALRLSDQEDLKKVMVEMELPEITYSMTNGMISVSVDGVETLIGRNDIRFSKVKEALESDDLAKVPSLVKVEGAFEGTKFAYTDGKILYSLSDEVKEEIPQGLADKMLQALRLGLPLTPFMNFWEKLSKNPSYNSRTQLFKFLDHKGLPITEEGDFVAYRSITMDWKDHHTKTMDNSVGQVVKMDRRLISDSASDHCSVGLHCAAFSYANDFGSQDRKLVEVLVSPENVVSCPSDYNFQKLRVCEFKVLREVEFESKKVVYESDLTTDDIDHDLDDDFEHEDTGMTQSQEDEIAASFNEFESRYSGDGLLSRISEDTGYDEDEIADVLDKKGLW